MSRDCAVLPPLIHAPLAETGFSHNRMGHQLLGGRSVLAGASAGKNVVFLPRSGCCVTAKAPVGTCTLGEMDGKGCHWRELVALLRLLEHRDGSKRQRRSSAPC